MRSGITDTQRDKRRRLPSLAHPFTCTIERHPSSGFRIRMNQASLSALIWSVADLLRGDYKQSEYGRVILPFTVLRRLDCVLEPPKKRC